MRPIHAEEKVFMIILFFERRILNPFLCLGIFWTRSKRLKQYAKKKKKKLCFLSNHQFEGFSLFLLAFLFFYQEIKPSPIFTNCHNESEEKKKSID